MLVWGTVACNLKLRGFSWKRGINSFASHWRLVVASRPMRWRICLPARPTRLNRDNRSPGLPSLLRPPVAVTRGTEILIRFPSTTPFGLALGADSPCADWRCAGTLGLPARGIFTPFIVTHVSIRTCDTSSMPLDTPSQTYTTLLYHASKGVRSFGDRFSPVTSSAQADSTSELLRFL